MARNALFAALMLAVLAGCSKVDLDVVGQWTGGFVPEKVDAPDHVKVSGYLQLYARKNFKLELVGPHQRIYVEGEWKQDGTRVTLSGGEVSFDNPTEEDQQVLKLKIVSPDGAREVYGKPLVLDLSTDKAILQGLDLELDGIAGAHRFRKPQPKK